MAMYVAQTTNFTVTNNSGGTIHGRGNYAVYYYAATSQTLTNNSGGTVTSTGSYAAQFSNSSNITLTNAGTISSGDDYPVFIGDTIHTNVTIKEKKDDPKRPQYGQVNEACEIINQNDKVVCYSEHILLVERKDK